MSNKYITVKNVRKVTKRKVDENILVRIITTSFEFEKLSSHITFLSIKSKNNIIWKKWFQNLTLANMIVAKNISNLYVESKIDTRISNNKKH